ncbi:MAG TPA: cyclic pyranopterin monophosphate synthase MoaC [Gemmatimonadaceae bacterium]|nr:cyclic pyranopterin monophosphate synthase MoaC [Gemmatimonadaceae bacterium]
MTSFSHLDESGKARMVDVSEKPATAREARADGEIVMSLETLKAIETNVVAKGDVLSVAQLAGVMAAKRTGELIPLCHPIPLTDVRVVLRADPNIPGVRCEATVRTIAQTGVEMEAMTAVSVALLTVYDMAKAADRGMEIRGIKLLAKSGGRSGTWKRSEDRG